MAGSIAADTLEYVCEHPHRLYELPKRIMNYVGVCPVPQGFASLVAENGDYSDKIKRNAYARIQAAYRKHVTAAMCGITPNGLTVPMSVTMSAVSSFVQYPSPSDGMVEWDSCSKALEGKDWRMTYRSKFYMAKINHIDGTFRHGDGFWGAARKPIRWFECLL